MRKKDKGYVWIISGLMLVMSMAFSGCSHLDKGWSQFEKGQYAQAKAEWQQEEKEDLSEPIAKADAAMAIVGLHNEALAAKEAGNNQVMVDKSIEIVAYDKWENKDWLQRSPILLDYITQADARVVEGLTNILTRLKQQAEAAQAEKNYEGMLRYAMAMPEKETEQTRPWFDKTPALQQLVKDGHSLVEEAYYGIMSSYAKQQYYVDVQKEFKAYKAYTERYDQPVSQRLVDLNAQAIAELEKRKKVLAEYNAAVECAKQQFIDEAYDKADACIQKADGYIKRNKNVRFNTDELDYVREANAQAIEIQKQIEEEKARIAEEERKRIEEEQKRIAAEELRKERERQRTERASIRLARASERQRLIKLAEERRKEAERQRKIEERNRRWRAFLKKGAPLKPLVTTVLKPSEGVGILDKGEKQKWQGGSQLPKPKDKSIRSEDVYALEVEVPKTHALTYLRNYYKENTKNLLSPPRTQGGKRSYYTEDFKGGRYYMEVENERGKKEKYEVKARIYKIPVTF